MTEITRAEKRARVLAEILEEAGWTVTVEVDRKDPIYYSDGGVLMQAHVFASVSAVGPERWDDGYGFTYVSWLPAPGKRASTKYAGGHVHLAFGSRKPSKKISQRELRSRIGSEAAMGRLRAERKSQEA